MKYNIKTVIKQLQKFQTENSDIELIDENELKRIISSVHKINHIDFILDKLEDIEFESDLCCNKTDLASILNISRVTLDKWIKEGIIDVVTDALYENIPVSKDVIKEGFIAIPANNKKEKYVKLNDLRNNLIKLKKHKET